jgi:hypothetical protein
MITIKLDKNLSCEKICAQIQLLINQTQASMNMANSLLVIDIKNIIDSDTVTEVPKLTYNNSPD